MENFYVVGDANWRGQDGAIMADRGKGGFLVSKKSYRDFEMRAEFYAESNTNSGIFILMTDTKTIGSKTSYEVNIFDTRPDPAYGTGAIVNVAKVAMPIKAGGKWNTYEIKAQGSHLEVTLNGVKTVDVQDAKHARGPIGLQYGAGVVKFRNVQVRSL